MARKQKTEEEKFNAFQQSKSKLRAKYELNLTESAEGCRCGMRWSDIELMELVRITLSFQGDFTIADIVGKMDRPAHGITSKLTKLGLFAYQRDRFYSFAPTNRVYLSRHREKPYFQEFISLLKENGWAGNTEFHSALIAPDWWVRLRNIKIGEIFRNTPEGRKIAIQKYKAKG